MGNPSFSAPSGQSIPLVQRANVWLEEAWSRRWFDCPLLEPDAIIRAAGRVTGLEDFGPDIGWKDRLDLLCAALDADADLTAVGTTIAYGQLLSALASRQRAAELWRRHPEILDVPITRPIIVVGQMRSGSTRMQRLLACDDRLTFTRFFESWNPVPRWPACPIDDRMLRGWLALRVAGLLNPSFTTVHPVRTQDPDEEIGIHNVALFGAAFEAQWRIPDFAHACETADSLPVYTEFRRYLQTIRWLRKDRTDRPWVLKIPQLGQDLRTVLEVFPDARVVHLERQPVKVVASSASLVYNQMAVQTRNVDRQWIGREWLRKTVLRKQRIAEGLRHREVPHVTIAFDDMHDDWRSRMRQVYALINLPLTARVEDRMDRYLSSRRHRRLTAHKYDIAHFGLTAAEVERAYAMGVQLTPSGATPVAA